MDPVVSVVILILVWGAPVAMTGMLFYLAFKNPE